MISGQTLATFRIDEATGRVVLEMAGHADLELGWREGLRGSREGDELDWMLTAFRSTLSSLRPSLDALLEAFRTLEAGAAIMAHRLVDDDATLLNEIRRRFEKRWRQWRMPGDVVPVVEVIGHDDMFPFEFLRCFDFRSYDGFANYAEAEDAFRSFLGFGTVVRRVTAATVEAEPLRRSPRLAVQFLRYEMQGAVAEEDYFGRVEHQLEIDGPSSPDPAAPAAERVDRVIDVLYDPRRRLDGSARSEPAQVHHFACHCDTSGSQASDTHYTFTLGSDDDTERCAVTLGVLRSSWPKRLQEGAFDGPRPLVVMNACGTSVINVRTAGSFPKWFLRQRHRAFVGTETEVPDVVAAAFAERLYDELLDSQPLGEALVRARRRLMAEELNPLGLLYVMHGDPALVVAGDEEAAA